MRAPAARRQRRPRDTGEYLEMVARIIHAAGDRVAAADPDQLAQLIDLRRELDEVIVQAVAGLRDSGATWEAIGSATGTTRQAAQLKWGAKIADL